MSKNPDKPESTGRRRFFRQFLASAVEGVEELGRGLNEAKRELEAQRRKAWYEHTTPSYDPAPWKAPVTYGPPWPPLYGPPIPPKVRQSLRERQRYYYHGGPLPSDMPDPQA